MRILLDEDLPRRLGTLLVGHEVNTVPRCGWSGIKNGKLLALAAAKFDVFLILMSVQVETIYPWPCGETPEYLSVCSEPG